MKERIMTDKEAAKLLRADAEYVRYLFAKTPGVPDDQESVKFNRYLKAWGDKRVKALEAGGASLDAWDMVIHTSIWDTKQAKWIDMELSIRDFLDKYTLEGCPVAAVC